MNVLVINGSPKGDNSITLQTVLFLEKKFKKVSFEYLNVGARYRIYEKDFKEPASKLEKADLILFSYPVYTFIVPSQLHRFVELMKESGLNLNGKFATQITTSKHFYDVTAHRFIEENCMDMGLKVIKGLSADMDDLLSKKGQSDAIHFMKYVKKCVSEDLFETPEPPKARAAHVPVVVPNDKAEKSGDVVIVADLAPDDTQLADMISRFRAVIPLGTRVVNIHEFNMKGGCLSCFNCATDGKCIYKDGFDSLLREEIQTAQAIVLAFSIKDHSMGSRFKMYDDRQFCNGHRTVTMGMPFAYIVSGNYYEEHNLRMIVDGRAEVGGNFLAGVACDQNDPDGEIDRIAKRLAYAVKHRYVQPQNFLGVGGMKIFRDLIWLMQGMMKADHKFYKEHGQYDFPQKKIGRMLAMYLVGGLMGNEKLKAKMGNKMNEGMLAPYKKIINK